jgi:undecaprenyl-diphosphatase
VIDDVPKFALAAALATIALLALWPLLDRRSPYAARLRRRWRARGFRRGLLMIAVLLTLVVITEDVVEVERDEFILKADERIVTAFAEPPARVRHAAAVVSHLTGEGLAGVLVATVGILLVRRRGRDATILTTTAIGAWAASGLVKAVLLVPRPRAHDMLRVTASYGFPSGHVLVTLVTCGTLVWLLRPRRRGVRALLMLGVWIVAISAGASRVILNAHWPSDVAAALALGALWLLALPAVAGEAGGTPVQPTSDVLTPVP